MKNICLSGLNGLFTKYHDKAFFTARWEFLVLASAILNFSQTSQVTFQVSMVYGLLLKFDIR